MFIKKAIIPAAGLGTRFLPLTKSVPKEMIPILDVPTIDLVVHEAVESGIEEILIIISESKQEIVDYYNKNTYLERYLSKKHKNNLLKKIKNIGQSVKINFAIQKEPKGLADAIYQAKSFTNDEPFVVMLGDDIILQKANQPTTTEQIINIYNKTLSTVLSVRECELKDINKYGVISPKSTNFKSKKIFAVDSIVEKPEPNDAPSNLAITGRYVFTKEIYSCIEKISLGVNNEKQITDAIRLLINDGRVFAWKYDGNYYDIGSRLGLVLATIDVAVKTPELRQEVLKHIKHICKNKR